MAENRYEAFISYRHLPPDTAAAESIEKALEAYKIPRALRKKAGRVRLNKCFRDRDELPLSDDLGESIDAALLKSDWLIVVCTPDLPKSKWCMREIDRFIELGRRDRIIPVLLSGEPAESYPRQLRFMERGGKTVEVEPLSADLRTQSPGGLRKKLRVEKLRIVARILGVGFDELRRRQRERRLKLALSFSAAAAALLLLFLVYAFVQNARIDEQRVLAATSESSLLIEKSLLYIQQDKRSEARQLALEAYNVTKTIRSVNAKEALDALAAACYAGDFQTAAVLRNTGMVMHAQAFSPDDRYVAGVIGRTFASCFVAATGELLWSVNLEDQPLSSLQYSPDGSKLLVMSADSGKLWVLDSGTGEALASTVYGGYRTAAYFIDDGHVVLTIGKNASVWAFADGTQEPLFDTSTVDWPGVISVSAAGAPDLLTWLSQDGSGVFVIGDRLAGTLTVYQTGILSGMTACGYPASMDAVAVCGGGRLTVMDLDTGGVRWSQPAASDTTTAPLWLQNGLVYFAKIAYDALTGEVRYTIGTDEPSDTDGSFYQNVVMDAFPTPDGRYVILEGSYYRADTGEKICTLQDGKIVLALSNDGETLLVGNTGADFTLLHALGAGTQAFEPAYLGKLVDIPNWSPLKGSENGMVMLTEDPVYDYVNSYLQQRMYVTPDGRFAVMTNEYSYIAIYDMDIGNAVAHRLYGQTDGISDAAVSADSRLIAFAGSVGMVTVYDLIENRTLQTMTDAYGKQGLRGIKFNAGGDMVMVQNHNAKVYWVYSVLNGALLYRMHAIAPAADFGFDAATGNAVILYEDGSASVAKIFTSKENLLAFALGE